MGGFTTNTDKDAGALHKTLKVVNLEQKHTGHKQNQKGPLTFTKPFRRGNIFVIKQQSESVEIL